MDSQAGLLLAGGSGGSSGGDLHGSQAAAAAAALQVGSQPLPEHGLASGQPLFTGTDNGEPAFLTLEVHSALASNRPPLGSAVSPQTTAVKSRSRNTTSPQKLEQLAAGLSPSPPSLGKGTQASKVCAVPANRGNQQRQEQAAGMSGEHQAEGQQLGSATGGGEPPCSVHQAATALQLQQLSQQAAGCGQSDSKAATDATDRVPGGSNAATDIASDVSQAAAAAAAAAQRDGEADPAPSADVVSGLDLPATQLVWPGTLPATARATQLQSTTVVTQLPATAPVRASLPASADLSPAATPAGAQPRASQVPLLATQEVGLAGEDAVQHAQQAVQQVQEQQQEQDATQLAATVAAAAVAQALAVAQTGSPAAGIAVPPAGEAAEAVEADQQPGAEGASIAALQAPAVVVPAAPQAAAAVEPATDSAVPVPVPPSGAAEAAASFIPLPSALVEAGEEAAVATAGSDGPVAADTAAGCGEVEEAVPLGAGDTDMPDAADAASQEAEPMDVKEAALHTAAAIEKRQHTTHTAAPAQAEQLVAAEQGPSQQAAAAAAAVTAAATPASASELAGSLDTGRSSSLYSYSSDESGGEGSLDGGEHVPPSPICTAEQVSIEQQRTLDAFLGRGADTPSVAGLTAGSEPGPSQFQSLHGLAAETQLDLLELQQGFKHGVDVDGLKTSVAGESVQGALAAVLPGVDPSQVHLPSKNMLQRAVWSGFRQLGLDRALAFQDELGEAAAVGVAMGSVAATEALQLPDAEVERLCRRYLCSSSEAEARRQRFEAEGEVQGQPRRKRQHKSRSRRTVRSAAAAALPAGKDAPGSTARQRPAAAAGLAEAPAPAVAEPATAPTEVPPLGSGPEALELHPTQGTVLGAAVLLATAAVGAPADGPSQLEITQQAVVTAACAAGSMTAGTGTLAAASAMVALPAGLAFPQAGTAHAAQDLAVMAALAADGVSQLEVELTLQAPAIGTAGGPKAASAPTAVAQRGGLPPNAANLQVASLPAPQRPADPFDLLLASQPSQPHAQQQTGPSLQAAGAAADSQSPPEKRFGGSWLLGGWSGTQRRQEQQEQQQQSEQQQQPAAQTQGAGASADVAAEPAPGTAGAAPGSAAAPSPGAVAQGLAVAAAAAAAAFASAEPAAAAGDGEEATPSGLDPLPSTHAVVDEAGQVQQAAQQAGNISGTAPSAAAAVGGKDSVPETPLSDRRRPEQHPGHGAVAAAGHAAAQGAAPEAEAPADDAPPASPDLGTAPQPGFDDNPPQRLPSVPEDAGAGGEQHVQPAEQHRHQHASGQQQQAATSPSVVIPDTEEEEAERAQQLQDGFRALPLAEAGETSRVQHAAAALADGSRALSESVLQPEPAAGAGADVPSPGGDAPPSSQAVRQALDAVAALSTHLAATQEALPPLAEEPLVAAGPAPARQQEAAQPRLDVAAALEKAAAADEEAGGLPVSPGRQHRWRLQQQGQLRFSDSEDEEPAAAAAAAAAQRRHRSGGAGPAEAAGRKIGKMSKKERRRSLLAAVMAPAGARPDLGLPAAGTRKLIAAPAAAAAAAGAGAAGKALPAGQQQQGKKCSQAAAAGGGRGSQSPKSPGRRPPRSPLTALRKSPELAHLAAAPHSPARPSRSTARKLDQAAAAAPGSPSALGGAMAMLSGAAASTPPHSPPAAGRAARVAASAPGNRAAMAPGEALLRKLASGAAVADAPVEAEGKKHSGLIDDAPCFINTQLADAAAAGAAAAAAAAAARDSAHAAAAAAAADAAAMPPPPARKPPVAQQAAPRSSTDEMGAAEAEAAAARMAAKARQHEQPRHPTAALAQQAAAAAATAAADPYGFPSSVGSDQNCAAAQPAAAGGGGSPIKGQQHASKQANAAPPASAAVVVGAAVGIGVAALGAGERRRKRRQEEAAAEEEKDAGAADEPGLLVTLLPHPVVQTAPDGGGFDGEEASGAADGSKAAQAGKPPARQASSPAQRAAGNKRAAASPAVAARPTAWAKRQRTTLGAAASVAAAGEVTPPPAVMPDSEDQTISEYLRTHPRVKLGCSKCRYSKGGCGKCRADAGAIAGGVSPAVAAATSPVVGRHSAGRRLQLQPPQQGAAPAPASKTPVAAAAAAGQQLRRRRERQQREEDEAIPSQDLAGSKAPPLISPAVAARRKWSAGASGRCFDGCVFLVTGFGDATEEKRAVLRALREGGATVADAVPDPPAAQGAAVRRQSAGARQLALQPAITAVVTDRRIRTPKYLYAVIKGLPIVKPAWVLACVKAKQQLPMREDLHLWWTPPLEPPAAGVFAGLRVHLHGARQFTQPFGQLLLHAGASLARQLEAPGPGGSSEPACDLLLLDEDEGTAGTAGAAGSEASRVAADLKRLARRLRIPVHERNWAIQALLEGTLPADFGAGSATPGRPRLAAAPVARGHSGSGSGAGSAGQAGGEAPLAGGSRAAAAAAGGTAAPAAGHSASSPRRRKRMRAAAGVEQQVQQPHARQPQQDQRAEEVHPSRRRRQQQEPSAVEQLCGVQPGLDRQVCAAICQALPASATGQQAVAAWLAGAGCRTAAEVVATLDSSQQVWSMALAATQDAGVLLVHWASLLNACKQLNGQAVR